jgi:SagB-type dehydrogenase family enzyme
MVRLGKRAVPHHTGRVRPLPVPKLPFPKSFEDVLDRRKSRRDLSPPTWDDIGALLWYAARSREASADNVQHRASPSAGGLHSIDVLVLHRGRLYLYNPIAHNIQQIIVANTVIRELKEAVREIVPDARGDALMLVGNNRVISAKYSHSKSLLWRDAGCLIATLGLCAEWLDLGFCALGILGLSPVQRLFADDAVVACGVCIVGRPHLGTHSRP